MPMKRNTYQNAYPNVLKVVAATFAEKRKERKQSQEELASHVDVTRNCVQQIECEEHFPHVVLFLKLIRELKIDPEPFINALLAALEKDEEQQRKETETEHVLVSHH